MNIKFKTQSLLFALAFCVSLIGVSFVYGAIPKNNDVETGAQLIENKIDFLISSLEEDPEIKISEEFKESSHIYKWIHFAIKNPDVPIYHAVMETGRLHEKGEDPLLASIQLNRTIRKLLELVRVHEDLDPDTLEVIDALIALIDASPEAYGRDGIITSAASNPKGTTKYDYELAPDATSNFRYYGKLYDLDNDASMDPRGILELGFPPVFLSPFYTVGDSTASISIRENGGGGPGYRRYSWNVQDQGVAAVVAAKLFESTKMPPIVFDYYNEPSVVDSFNGNLIGSAGLSAGDGSAGQPGAGVGRSTQGMTSLWNPDLPASAYPITYAGDLYTSIFNLNGSEGFHDILLDTNVVFMPHDWDIDSDPPQGALYRVSLVTRNLVVDSLSVDGALVDVAGDPDLLDTLTAGEYRPGIFDPGGTWTTLYNPDGTEVSTGYSFWDGYEYGLQTVGQSNDYNPTSSPEAYMADFAWFDNQATSRSLDMLNSDGLLAYMVQVEEDRVNRKVIEMARNRGALNARASAYRLLGYSDIRARDAAFVEMADAQSGKVLKDIHGNWVRVQQYILRPSNMEVQFLNVCLRGGDGPLAGFSTMDFTTTFANEGGYGTHRDLRDLPWNEWLDTRETDGGDGQSGFKYVFNGRYNAPEVVLDNMYVTFINPGGEALKESRFFSPVIEDIANIQKINSERLKLGATSVYTNDYTTGEYDPGNLGINEYATVSGGLGGGFSYVLGNANPDIQVDFHAVGDEDDSGNNEYPGRMNDIWTALATNEPGHSNIGTGNNLEIVIDPTADGDPNRLGNYFNNPIDVVYVPMSRMLWKDKEVVDVN